MHKITLICVFFGLLDVIKCDWWENVLIYEIYTKSFKDSDGDGIGDINGVTSKLDYIAELGADAIWLPGIYATSSNHFEQKRYDITDHKQLNSILGEMNDFRNLLSKAKQKSLKVLLDFVPGYTSNEHIWFLKSEQNETIYTDYYVWANPKAMDKNKVAIPPANPADNKPSSGWIFSKIRKQFYYSNNGTNEPKVNLGNPLVLEEMKKILHFWLDLGIDGFIVKDSSRLTDKSLVHRENLKESTTELQEIINKFRKILDEYKNKDGSTRLLIADIEGTIEGLDTFYDRRDYKISHFPFNQQHLMSHYDGFVDSKSIKLNIDSLLNSTSQGKLAAWASESWFRSRIAADWGLEYVTIAAVQTLLLPGPASIFYGQEIGLRGIDPYSSVDPKIALHARIEFILDLYKDQFSKCPMQWDDSTNAGFTTSDKRPWSDIRPDYWKYNVEYQQQRKDSYYNFYKELIKLRKTDTGRYGDVKTYELSEYVFAFTRFHPLEETYVAVFNFNDQFEYVELNPLLSKFVKSLTVLLASSNSYQKAGMRVMENTDGKFIIKMRPISVIVFSTDGLGKK